MSRSNAGDPNPSTQLSPFQSQPRVIATQGQVPFAGQSMPPAGKHAPTAMGLLYALKRRWVLATFVGMLIGVLAGVGVWMAFPGGKHLAKASVEIRNDGIDFGKKNDDTIEFIRNQPYLIKTRDVYNRTLAEPSVHSLPLIKDKDPDEQVHYLEEGVDVKSVTPTILQISLAGDSTEEMKTVLDVLVKKYLDDANLADRTVRDKRVQQLERLYDQLNKDVQSKDRDLKRLIDNNQTLGRTNEAKVSELQAYAATARAELKLIKDQIDERQVLIDLFAERLAKGQISLDPIDVDRAINVSIPVALLLQERLRKQALLDREKNFASDTAAPLIMQLHDSIKQIDKDLITKRAEVRPEVEQELRGQSRQLLQQRIESMNEEQAQAKKIYELRKLKVAELDSTIRQNTVGDFEIESLRKELEPEKEYLKKIKEQALSYQLVRDGDPRVKIRENVYIQRNQNLKSKMLAAIAAGFGSFGLVVLIIGLLEWRSRRIDGVDQVVNELGMRIIGTVPAFPTKANIKQASEGRQANWRFILNESINSTRTMLLHSARHHQMQVVMITSATQGEGKTSLASQLGTSMATAGMRTLIVDCDLRNPSINKLFDLSVSPGVSEVLCQEVDVSDAVQPTNVPNLWVIPAGQCSNRVIAALAQGHPLETLFNRLRGQFDFILVDSCPVLPVADALLIGQHVDGVLFSIMQDISQLPKVMTASEKLAQLNILLLGAVVNGIRNDVYSYGYNYVKQLPA